MNFVHELCKARPKGNLPALMAHIVAVLGEYAAAHPAAPPALARSMDGAMLAIGTLAEILKVWGGCGGDWGTGGGSVARCPALGWHRRQSRLIWN